MNLETRMCINWASELTEDDGGDNDVVDDDNNDGNNDGDC